MLQVFFEWRHIRHHEVEHHCVTNIIVSIDDLVMGPVDDIQRHAGKAGVFNQVEVGGLGDVLPDDQSAVFHLAFGLCTLHATYRRSSSHT